MQSILIQSITKGEIEEMISQSVAKAFDLYAANSFTPVPEPSNASVSWLTKKQAAHHIGVSLPTLSKYIKLGYVKAHTVAGTRMRFKVSELDKALKMLNQSK